MVDDPVLKPGAVALVTGASSGIGAAVAKMLAERGVRVICAARRRERLGEVIGHIGERAVPLQLDVADAASVATLFERLSPDLHAIDILINSAGHDIGGRKRFDQGDVDEWTGIIETNVNGMIRVSHAVAQAMVARGRGHIVNLGSVAGLRVYRGGSIYNASKFAVRALAEALRKDYADTDIRVTEILPGMTRTGFAAARLHGDEAEGAAYYENFPRSWRPRTWRGRS